MPNTTTWFWNMFIESMIADGLEGLPVASRLSVPWRYACVVEDYTIRVILYERTKSGEFVQTPESDGIPCFFRYKLLTMFYGREPTQVTQIHTKEWALVATIDGGQLPQKHEASFVLTETNDVEFSKEVFDAGLVTQPYMNGLVKYASKFRPDQPYSATIAIEKGCHLDHGTSIFFEQGTRRCVLCDTLFGLTDDEALWFTMYEWAEFQPRKCRPRQDPGLLYYPAE
jgi:hypothetical protein